jgi:hypothetical protein
MFNCGIGSKVPDILKDSSIFIFRIGSALAAINCNTNKDDAYIPGKEWVLLITYYIYICCHP